MLKKVKYCHVKFDTESFVLFTYFLIRYLLIFIISIGDFTLVQFCYTEILATIYISRLVLICCEIRKHCVVKLCFTQQSNIMQKYCFGVRETVTTSSSVRCCYLLPADISKVMQAKKKRLESLTKNYMKGSQHKLEQLWNSYHAQRFEN